MIGVIADDLTGAAELGAIGLRHGLRPEIVRNGGPSGQSDLVCVDTDSRSCEPATAAKRATVAAKLLSAAGAAWIYKKVDSVLRGQVTAEVEAVMKQLQLDRALLLPARYVLWFYRQQLLDFVGRASGEALDVGCGEGRVSRAMKECGYRVTATDGVTISQNMPQ